MKINICDIDYDKASFITKLVLCLIYPFLAIIFGILVILLVIPCLLIVWIVMLIKLLVKK